METRDMKTLKKNLQVYVKHGFNLGAEQQYLASKPNASSEITMSSLSHVALCKNLICCCTWDCQLLLSSK